VARPVPTAQIISVIAGVTKSTVSRALQGDERISLETRQRILKIAEKVGYTPNAVARSLTTKQSGIIGYAIGQTENVFFQEQLERISLIAHERNARLMLFSIPDGQNVTDVLPVMLQYRLDGCIVIASVPITAGAVEKCMRYRMPLVLLNRIGPKTGASSVLCDNVGGARDIVRFLLASDHSRIAYIGGRPGSAISQDRERGMREAFDTAGEKLYDERVGHFTFEGGRQAARELMSTKARPDAIFAANDLMAFGAIDAVKEIGLRIPEDVSVVGFDGARAGAWPAYNLTTMVQPVESMFTTAIEFVERQRIEPLRPPETVYIAPQFLQRGSSRLPKARTPGFVGSPEPIRKKGR